MVFYPILFFIFFYILSSFLFIFKSYNLSNWGNPANYEFSFLLHSPRQLKFQSFRVIFILKDFQCKVSCWLTQIRAWYCGMALTELSPSIDQHMIICRVYWNALHQYHNMWLNYLVEKNYWEQNYLRVGQLHCSRIYNRNWDHGLQRGIFWRYCTICRKCMKKYSETRSVGFTKLPKESVEQKNLRIPALNHRPWFVLCFLWEDNERAREAKDKPRAGPVSWACDPCSEGGLVLGIHTLQAPSWNY